MFFLSYCHTPFLNHGSIFNDGSRYRCGFLSSQWGVGWTSPAIANVCRGPHFWIAFPVPGGGVDGVKTPSGLMVAPAGGWADLGLDRGRPRALTLLGRGTFGWSLSGPLDSGTALVGVLVPWLRLPPLSAQFSCQGPLHDLIPSGLSPGRSPAPFRIQKIREESRGKKEGGFVYAIPGVPVFKLPIAEAAPLA